MDANVATDTLGSPSPAQIQQLYQLVGGYRVSHAIYVVAKLGIADLLADGPKGSDELARSTEANEPALYRVLRFLTGVGLFDEVTPRRFGLTALGVGLRTDTPGSISPMALMALDRFEWQPWGDLLHSVRTGETAFDHVHGMGVFDYLREHPDSRELFHRAMTSNTARSGDAITRAYDLSGVRRLVDVGGGHGLLLATVLQAYPAMRGVLYDLPEVVAGAAPALEVAGVADRCEVVGGDFFATVAPGGDAYVLRQIIHDWDDARAAAILTNCRRAMEDGGKVLVLERAIAPDYRQAMAELHLDMEMLVNVGGIQRTEAEYGALFAASGLRLSAVVPLGDTLHYSVYEGVSA
ncbi:MAG: methyltransferase [Candidatus Dormibacteraeota bacterium]|uniref:Methyltransferase n=1 Tax=Candidatus Aeolococcus gillhamiae TaxID=3127015 RepID=A0A934JQF8_9BACT|nr:methyltransferase [Candidatus Dormibacteraeota bacterium]